MEIMGEQARKGIDNFMKAFPDYKIEHVVADIEIKPTKIKGSLQIKIRTKESRT